jgi:hypothetical protein
MDPPPWQATSPLLSKLGMDLETGPLKVAQGPRSAFLVHWKMNGTLLPHLQPDLGK